MRNVRSFVIFFISALLAACGGALNPPAGNVAPMSARSHAQATAAAAGYKQLYAFKGTPDGASPYSGLVAVNNVLYGTTLNGSSNYCTASCTNNCYLGCGTVFSVDRSGNEHVVYDFKGNFNSGTDGSWPFAGLTELNGELYGVASGAGAYQHGAVYTVTPSGGESVLSSFTDSGKDGAAPEAALFAYKNDLYGTTVIGGGTGCGGSGCGALFVVPANGVEHTLYAFGGGSAGDRLYAPVTHVGNKLYGATLEGGGTGCGGSGCGTIYVSSLHGKEHVLYTFKGTTDGAYPNGLTAADGVLYGTTEGGGTKNSGTFFSVTSKGQLTTLYNFLDIPDGNLPGATLIYAKGNFYGTTVGGGTAGVGTVFKITPSGTGEKVLYSFLGGSDGSDPQGPVYLYKGMLYGTTTTGGGTGCANSAGCGTVFRVKP
jgi:uncharacterized repeat protein (TIGR03803 family)